MIGSALTYPLDPSRGRRHLFGVTGALLVTAIALRIAFGLYPLVLSLVPAAGALIASVVGAGIFVETFLRPDKRIPDLRSLLRTGSVATCVAVATLVLPVALLFWTVLSYSSGGFPADSGTGVFFLVGSTTSIVTFLAATYVLPVLVARTVVTGLGWEAADGRQLRIALTAVPYLQGWSLGIALAVLGWWAVATGLTLTNLTGLIAIAGGSYCLLAGARVVGKGYAGVPGVNVGT